MRETTFDHLEATAAGAWLAVHDRMADRPAIDSAVGELLRMVAARDGRDGGRTSDTDTEPTAREEDA
jgi:hypothetical protein